MARRLRIALSEQIALGCGIGDGSIGANYGGFRHASRLKLALAHDVDDRFARG
jgi:hypothetical protein